MRYVHKVALVLLPVVVLALAGCGGSSGGTASDPFSKTAVNTGTDPGTAAVPNPSTPQNPDFSLTLATDLAKPTDLSMLPQVDVNIGTVLVSATLLNMSGGVFVDPTSNQPIAAGAAVPEKDVSFRILAGPGSIDFITQKTDKNGVCNAIFTTGNVNHTSNVIIEATATVGSEKYRAYTSFQIVRGTGVIMFTDAAGTSPGGQSNILPERVFVVDPAGPPTLRILQLLPFKLTDSNGNPRVAVPVTLSLYSITTLNPNDVTIDFLVPPISEPNQQTITSDSAGQGIFNVATTMATPGPTGATAVVAVFKAVTNDAIPVTAYVGVSYSLAPKPAAPAEK